MVMVMSNGSFDGLSGKLLEKFKSLAGAPEMKSARRIVLAVVRVVFRRDPRPPPSAITFR